MTRILHVSYCHAAKSQLCLYTRKSQRAFAVLYIYAVFLIRILFLRHNLIVTQIKNSPILIKIMFFSVVSLQMNSNSLAFKLFCMLNNRKTEWGFYVKKCKSHPGLLQSIQQHLSYYQRLLSSHENPPQTSQGLTRTVLTISSFTAIHLMHCCHNPPLWAINYNILKENINQ